MKDFGAYLSKRRQFLGKSQSDFARALHYSVQAVAKYEKSQSEINVSSLLAVARFLEVDVDSLCQEATTKNDDRADNHSFDAALFARNLITLRENQGLAREEASKASGISPRSLANYELGRSTPNLSIFLSLAKLYGVKPSAVLLDEIPATQPKSPEKRPKKAPLILLLVAAIALSGAAIGIPLWAHYAKQRTSSGNAASSFLSGNPVASSVASASATSSEGSSSSGSSSSGASSMAGSSTPAPSNVTCQIDEGATSFTAGSLHTLTFFEDGIPTSEGYYCLRASLPLSDGTNQYTPDAAFYVDYRANEATAIPTFIHHYRRDLNQPAKIVIVCDNAFATGPTIAIAPLTISDYAAEATIAKSQVDELSQQITEWTDKVSQLSTNNAALNKEGQTAGYIDGDGNLSVKKSDSVAQAWLSKYVTGITAITYSRDVLLYKGKEKDRAQDFYSYCLSQS
jgi:transcriptional regulator with XRE-family HTH domain